MNANKDVAALMDGLHIDALQSWGTLRAIFSSLSLRPQKLIVHEGSPAPKDMQQSARDILVEHFVNISECQVATKEPLDRLAEIVVSSFGRSEQVSESEQS